MYYVDEVRDWPVWKLFGPEQWCPVCGGHQFGGIPGGYVYCSDCNAEFVVSPHGGDIGVLIDCRPENDGTRGTHYIPLSRVSPDVPVRFYQVLKPCDGGLETRLWHSVSFADSGNTFSAPVGVPLALYDMYDVRQNLASEWARKRTAKGRAGDWVYVKWYVLNHWMDDRFSLGYEPEEGYYRQSDCDRVFEDDGMSVHRCIPKKGEQPVWKR